MPNVQAAIAPEAAPLESTEALREALFTLRRDHDALATTAAQAQQLLDALESLLAMGPDDEPFLAYVLNGLGERQLPMCPEGKQRRSRERVGTRTSEALCSRWDA